MGLRPLKVVLTVLLVTAVVVVILLLKGSENQYSKRTIFFVYADGDGSESLGTTQTRAHHHSNDSTAVSTKLGLKKLNTSGKRQGHQKQEKEKKKRFPDAIIIGVKKGGTRALIEMLSTHPAIKITKKEMQFFNWQYGKGLKWYISQMPLARASDIVMEKSPNYFNSREAPKRIHEQSKPVKLILIVRNPFDRAVSDYVHNKEEHNHNLSKFEDIVMEKGEVNPNSSLGLISKSLYDIHFQNWLRFFNRTQILVLNGDQLIHQPVAVLKKAERFLGVKSFFKKELFFINKVNGFYCWRKTPSSLNPICLGASKGRPHPTVDRNVTQKVNEFFKPHMLKFCQMAAVKFSWCTL